MHFTSQANRTKLNYYQLSVEQFIINLFIYCNPQSVLNRSQSYRNSHKMLRNPPALLAMVIRRQVPIYV